jgi:hypothetical protein
MLRTCKMPSLFALTVQSTAMGEAMPTDSRPFNGFRLNLIGESTLFAESQGSAEYSFTVIVQEVHDLRKVDLQISAHTNEAIIYINIIII